MAGQSDSDRLPPIFILSTNLTAEELAANEAAAFEIGLELSYDAKETQIFVGKIAQKKRATFELRKHGLITEELVDLDSPSKRRRLDTAEIERTQSWFDQLSEDRIVVFRLNWLKDCAQKRAIVSPEPYIVYLGQVIDQKPATIAPLSTSLQPTITYIKIPTVGTTLEASRKTHSPGREQTSSNHLLTALLPQEFTPRKFRDQRGGIKRSLSRNHPALKRSTTSEQDFIDISNKQDSLIPLPAWMLQQPHTRVYYACTRSTPADPINKDFIRQLYLIKEARLLTGDEIGVRAYSTSIASLSAYTHKIQYPGEITRLPGCNEKIAGLWVEWFNSVDLDGLDSDRSLEVTNTLSNNEDIKCLKTFFDIWGVGSDTARKFYYDRSWKDLDDVIEHGWSILTRVQQIGVKFYKDFKVKIPRSEVESIADVVLQHARLVRNIPKSCWSNEKHGYQGNWSKPDDGFGDPEWDPRDMVCVIVGGYRRGKLECGDVDVILSHKDESLTRNLVIDIVESLEQEGWITHTLSLHTTTSDRDQQTLPHKVLGHAGHGFDTLDKALCVWQDPSYDQEEHTQNPNTRRRVDIIISPWRTVGAAVLGWSGATTFERDIRKWASKERGWKFDSSGLRDRSSGQVVDLEDPSTEANVGKGSHQGDGWEDRERRLMEGLGIGWRPANERCTG